MSDYRDLRTTFDSAATLYHDARPDYPDHLYAELLDSTGLTPPARLLEVGCGSGKATMPLARSGFRITAIELGASLANEARHRLADYPMTEVITTPFESWQPDDPSPFSLVYAATSWHWIDARVKYARAAELLAECGYLAVWAATHAFPADVDPFFTEIQEVYDEIGESHPGEWPPLPPEAAPGLGAEFEESGLFDAIAVRRYVWGLRYTAEEYLRLLDTFSGHIAMDPAKRSHLYAEIRTRLARRPDASLTRHWQSVLTIGRAR